MIKSLRLRAARRRERRIGQFESDLHKLLHEIAQVRQEYRLCSEIYGRQLIRLNQRIERLQRQQDTINAKVVAELDRPV